MEKSKASRNLKKKFRGRECRLKCGLSSTRPPRKRNTCTRPWKKAKAPFSIATQKARSYLAITPKRARPKSQLQNQLKMASGTRWLEPWKAKKLLCTSMAFQIDLATASRFCQKSPKKKAKAAKQHKKKAPKKSSGPATTWNIS